MVTVDLSPESGVGADDPLWLYCPLSAATFLLETARIPATRACQYAADVPDGLPPTDCLRGVESGTVESVLSNAVLTEFVAHRGESLAMWERRGPSGVAVRTSVASLERAVEADRFAVAITSVSNDDPVGEVRVGTDTGRREPLSLAELWEYFGHKDASYDCETPVRLCGVRTSILDDGQVQHRKLGLAALRKHVGFDVDRRALVDEVVVGPDAGSWVADLLREYATEHFSLEGSIRGSTFG